MKNHTKIFSWTTLGTWTVNDLSYSTIIIVNLLYLIINKVNGYIEVGSGTKYFMLVPTGESKGTKKYKELWKKIRDFIRSITNNSDNYDETYMKMKINSYDILPLKNIRTL